MTDDQPTLEPQPAAPAAAAATAAAPQPAAPATAASDAATPPAAPSSSREALWILVVLGGFLALGALWFALFASPQVIGSDSGAPLGSGSQPASTTPAPSVVASTPTVPLTLADVNAVLAQIDYAESNDASATEYDSAVTRMMRGIDLEAFALATLEATSAISWTDVGVAEPRIVTGAEKDQLVAQAAAKWVASRDASGTDAPPLNFVLGVKMYPPVSVDRNLQDSLFEVMGQGLRPLGLMFGAHDADNEWTWKVVGVSVTGTDTADVTYTARASKAAGWKFRDPNARYTKQLRFARAEDGRWRLAGWSNYDAVAAQFRANLAPADATTDLDEWWGAL
jgi:hypothetical protein